MGPNSDAGTDTVVLYVFMYFVQWTFHPSPCCLAYSSYMLYRMRASRGHMVDDILECLVSNPQNIIFAC
jgi:hypothetical protein